MKMKLELVAVPVTDVDRAIAFYKDKVGFHLDHDQKVSADLRFVQLTPPDSACSIVMGKGITKMKPGSQLGLQMVVDDAQAAHNLLASNGVEVSNVDVMPWGKFVFFTDPDGNGWSLQELPAR
jgi:catechol 2,3-dioxygenase-like lactoylglutathione lyase family enzyme